MFFVSLNLIVYFVKVKRHFFLPVSFIRSSTSQILENKVLMIRKWVGRYLTENASATNSHSESRFNDDFSVCERNCVVSDINMDVTIHDFVGHENYFSQTLSPSLMLPFESMNLDLNSHQLLFQRCRPPAKQVALQSYGLWHQNTCLGARNRFWRLCWSSNKAQKHFPEFSAMWWALSTAFLYVLT